MKGVELDIGRNRLISWDADLVQFWELGSGEKLGLIAEPESKILGLCIDHLRDSEPGSGQAPKRSKSYRVFLENEEGIKINQLVQDYDFPPELYEKQAQVFTRLQLDPTSKTFNPIEADRWQELKIEYLKAVWEHYQKCQFPEACIFRQLVAYY